jgi:two-component system sensor histidine kinase BaeS
MSFRLRALALIMFIAVTATTATAWLTSRQASHQIRESVAAGRQEVALIGAGLRGYGLAHGTWDGIAATVAGLSHRTGQRIRVETDSGALLADSDMLAGGTARKVVGAPISVDPRPAFRLPAAGMPTLLVRLTVTAIGRYRSAVRYAACLTRGGAAVTAHPGGDGVPVVTAGAGGEQTVAACEQRQLILFEADTITARGCLRKSAGRLDSCLKKVFAARTSDAAPQRLQIYLGAGDQAAPSLRTGPTVVVALIVAAAAILGALLLSRGVLRPINTMTGAARRLGAGDLSHRIAVSGQDEIAELGRSFNRMADSLQESEERQRRLIGDVAHELRTPLANLRGYLEALHDGVVEPSPELLASLHEEVLLQQRIVEDLQDLALAEAGALTYHRGVVEVGELLQTCLTAHRALAEAAGVSLTVEVTEPVKIDADPDRLRQMFANLITNAVRASAPGDSIRLTATRDRASVTIRVRDTGAGIPAADLPHLFDRFWRADAARGRTTGGSGLGLAIARQIVMDHRGTISVASSPGLGTTFTVVLPAAGST